MEVPAVLTSGHHGNIKEWRHKESLRRTLQRRPDLIDEMELTTKEQEWLDEFSAE